MRAWRRQYPLAESMKERTIWVLQVSRIRIGALLRGDPFANANPFLVDPVCAHRRRPRSERAGRMYMLGIGERTCDPSVDGQAGMKRHNRCKSSDESSFPPKSRDLRQRETSAPDLIEGRRRTLAQGSMPPATGKTWSPSHASSSPLTKMARDYPPLVQVSGSQWLRCSPLESKSAQHSRKLPLEVSQAH